MQNVVKVSKRVGFQNGTLNVEDYVIAYTVGTLRLRLLLIFGGVLWEEIHRHASFNTTLTNYISDESLKNEVYDKNTI